MRARGKLFRGATLAAPLALAACGGGGGVQSTPTPIAATPAPTPPPTPAPIPTPTPAATANDTSEYRATVGAVSMNALAAYNAAASGRGVSIGIIDSGIDLQSPEFDGRISSASQAFAGSTSVDDESGHGTAVAFTAAGRRNGTGTHGVAFDATVIALRADRPGTCAAASTDDSDSGCKFPTDAIAAGVDAARAAGAKVINMSLGGSAMPANLQAAIGRATAAGIVVVIAAGNDGTDNPDAFTDVAGTPAANASVIIAGSVGAGGTLSSFSDKAGTGAAFYLTAVGEQVRAPDNNNTAYLWTGTSFAAPQITGAVALLAQAFPNLSGAQIVDLLLRTARDAGAPGTDPIYGRGILDLTRAFQPVGGTAVAGSGAVVAGSTGQLSAAMGDARAAGMGAVILDGYGRAFATDLAQSLNRAAGSRPLQGALGSGTRQVALAAGGTAVAMTLAPGPAGVRVEPFGLARADADRARAIAGTVTQRLGARTSFALAFRQGGLVAQLSDRAEPAFLVADAQGIGFDSTPRTGVAIRRQLGRWGVTAAAEAGDVLTTRDRLLPGRAGWQRSGYDRMALALDRRLGPLSTQLTATRLTERDTLLGARLGPALGSPDARSWFADMTARLDMGDGWTLGGSGRRGWTRAAVHGLAGDGRLRTATWSADIGKAGVFGRDSLGLRLAAPVRVTHGGLDLTLPTGWNYATGAVNAWTTQRLGLTPQGHELDAEARYGMVTAVGDVQANLYWRRDPGNIAGLPADLGAAVRWSLGF